MADEQLPKWARDRLRAEEKMGRFNTKVALGEYVGYVFVFVVFAALAGVSMWVKCGMVKAGIEYQTRDR